MELKTHYLKEGSKNTACGLPKFTRIVTDDLTQVTCSVCKKSDDKPDDWDDWNAWRVNKLGNKLQIVADELNGYRSMINAGERKIQKLGRIAIKDILENNDLKIGDSVEVFLKKKGSETSACPKSHETPE